MINHVIKSKHNVIKLYVIKLNIWLSVSSKDHWHDKLQIIGVSVLELIRTYLTADLQLESRHLRKKLKHIF